MIVKGKNTGSSALESMKHKHNDRKSKSTIERKLRDQDKLVPKETTSQFNVSFPDTKVKTSQTCVINKENQRNEE